MYSVRCVPPHSNLSVCTMWTWAAFCSTSRFTLCSFSQAHSHTTFKSFKYLWANTQATHTPCVRFPRFKNTIAHTNTRARTHAYAHEPNPSHRICLSILPLNAGFPFCSYLAFSLHPLFGECVRTRDTEFVWNKSSSQCCVFVTFATGYHREKKWINASDWMIDFIQLYESWGMRTQRTQHNENPNRAVRMGKCSRSNTKMLYNKTVIK